MNEFEKQRAEADAIANIVRAGAVPEVLDPSKPQVLVVPADARLEFPDLRAWRQAPERKTGTYRPSTVEAFLDYVETQHMPESSTIWVHPTSGRVEAVIDDNGDEPGYGQHRVVLQLTTTPEWDFWAASDKQMLTQEAFAEHIEGGLEEIVEPDAATMLEIAQSFHASSSATFRASTRLASGEQQLQYDEEVKAAAGASGELTVPTVILLAIAPFIGEDPYRLTARLRFRLNSGQLRLGYLLDRPESVQRDALEGVATKIAAKFNRTFVGEAPAA